MTSFTEDELVAAIRRILGGEAARVTLGPGDDAALVEARSGTEVLTLDMMVEGIHFELDTWAARDIGYKAVTVGVSDVAAMAGSPRFGLVGLGLPVETESAWVVELVGGMREAADEYAMSLVGGDVSRSDRITLSVAVTGEVADRRAISRSGARAGDRIVVTGELGAAAGGLLIARANPQQVQAAVRSEWGRDLMAAHFRPVARVGEAQTLAQAGATAMMDISDGLALDLSRLCDQSGVGAKVRLADVPVAVGLRQLKEVLPVEPLSEALEGGEDFELLATLSAQAVGPARSALAERFGTPLSEIGEILSGSGMTAVGSDGSERPLHPGGWDHFAR